MPSRTPRQKLSVVIWFVVGTLALAIAVFVWKARRVARLYTDAHFREILEGLPRLKSEAHAALAATGNAPPAHLLTQAPLIVAYSVSTEDGKFNHHFSLSSPLSPATAMGTHFLGLVEQGLGLTDETRAAVFVSQGRVFHLIHVLEPAAQSGYESASVLAESGDVHKLRELAMSRANTLQARISSEVIGARGA